MLAAIFKGVWLGFCIAAPVGPIGILVLKQSVQHGRGAGLASGLGAALADLVYGCLAAAGIGIAAGYGRLTAIIGGALLLAIALKTWRGAGAPLAADASSASSALAHGGLGARRRPGARRTWILIRLSAPTFLLTISNPMTILSFAAMVASVGAAAPAPFVAGVFAGSMAWWTILSAAAARLGPWLRTRTLLVSRISAIMLAGFGVWSIWSRGLR